MYSIAKSWGPYAWYTFHILSFSHDTKLIKHYHTFFELLKNLIPCHICQNHYIWQISRTRTSIGENCSDQERMSHWLINMHNNVNRMNRTKVYEYNEVRQIYFRNNKLHINDGNIMRFLNEFMKSNFKMRNNKRNDMLKLFKTIAYIYPNLEKRKQLTDFANKFNPNDKNFISWYKTFVFIIFGKRNKK